MLANFVLQWSAANQNEQNTIYKEHFGASLCEIFLVWFGCFLLCLSNFFPFFKFLVLVYFGLVGRVNGTK